jgi:hypothetical protein
MREGMGQASHRPFTATESMELSRDEKWAYYFSKYTKEICSMHGAWQSTNTVTTVLHGQAFRIIALYHHRDDSP